MTFLIDETLTELDSLSVEKQRGPYVSILTKKEWESNREKFDMGIEIDPGESEIVVTKAEVNYDSVTGTFSIPNRKDFSQKDTTFAFALDEKGVVFIDDSGTAISIVKQIQSSKKWRIPSLERFLYDFLDRLIGEDQQLLSKYEWELYSVERAITHGDDENGESITIDRVNDIRGDVRDLHNHYEQLLDLAEILEENENNFFSKENLRYFRLISNKIERLLDTSAGIGEYTMQIRDLY